MPDEAGRDLGTYHVGVVLADGRGFIKRWETYGRFVGGNGATYPLGAKRDRPAWASEEELLKSIVSEYAEGNFSCDCNKRSLLACAGHEDEPDPNPCGDELAIESLWVIRPDGAAIDLTADLKGYFD